jgi:hypothetical protein
LKAESLLVPGKETKRNGADSGKRKRSKPTQTLPKEVSMSGRGRVV